MAEFVVEQQRDIVPGLSQEGIATYVVIAIGIGEEQRRGSEDLREFFGRSDDLAFEHRGRAVVKARMSSGVITDRDATVAELS